jgi:hypothetical protein
MVLALSIFALLAGAVFTSVQAVTSASAVLAEEQVRARRLDAFLGWCRRGFRNLPARAQIILRTRETGSAGLAVDLLIRRAPGAFALGEFDALGPDLVISALPDGRGGATLSVARYPGSWSTNDIAKNLQPDDWVPLLEEIRLLRWTFWDPGQEEFVEQWPDGRPKPELIRLQMTLQTGEEYDAVFRPPRLVFRGDFSGDGEGLGEETPGLENPTLPTNPDGSGGTDGPNPSPNLQINTP